MSETASLASNRRFPTAAPHGELARVMLAFLATAGLFYVNIMPALVDGLIEALRFSNRDAGLVGSANVYGAAAGALGAVFLVRRIPWRGASISLLLEQARRDHQSVVIVSHNPDVGQQTDHCFRLTDGTLEPA